MHLLAGANSTDYNLSCTQLVNILQTMVSKTFSIRLTNAEVELLQSFQDPHGETLNQTVARLIREVIGANSVKAVNTSANTVNIKELIAEKIEQAANARMIDRELIRDEIAERTAYLATAMNEVKSQLENEIEFLKTRVKILEQNQEEEPEHSPVSAKATTQEVTLALLQDKENAIAPEVTEENVVLPQAEKKLSPEQLKSKSNTIAVTLEKRGLTISRDIIKAKMLELYPNPDDWKRNSDARRDVIRALEQQHK